MNDDAIATMIAHHDWNALDMLMIVNEAGGHLTCASDHAYERRMNRQTA